MINPDIVGVGEDNSITSPNILWIEIGDFDILDNDVGYTSHSQTFSVKNSVGTSANQCFVRGYIYALVSGNIDGG